MVTLIWGNTCLDINNTALDMSNTSLDVKYDLMKVGLTEREAKVYQVLVGVETLTAGAIPKFTDIPRTKVYEILDSLIRKGFCKEGNNNGEGQAYSAVHPKVALANLALAEEERINDMKRVNEYISKILTPIYDNSSWRLKNYDFVEVIRGRQEIITRYSELRSSTTAELLEFTKGPLAMSENEIKAESVLTEKMILSGVKVRAIYEVDKSDHSFDFAFKIDKEIGVDARFNSFLPVKLSLVDDKYTMIFMQDPMIIQPNLTGLVIEHAGMNALIKMAFESHWDISTPI